MPRLKGELLLFGGCLLAGLIALPIAIYYVGLTLFGAFGGGGLGDFFFGIQTDLTRLDLAAWFLVLSPYLIIQTLRLTFRLAAWARSN